MNANETTAGTDDELRALIALMSLKHAGPRRLRALLTATSAVDVVEALHRRQRPPEPPSDDPVSIPPGVWNAWFDGIRATTDSIDLDRYRSDGGSILFPGHPAWPFDSDPDPPILLFAKGDLGLLRNRLRCVAVVGTRRCTSVGRHVADALGADLAAAGLVIVSGLALGVDAAAHRGAISVGGPVIGVVASGLDVVYPASNQTLWRVVADDGLLVSEVPMGQRPTKWRFPARNRLIAGVSSLVVVVESHARGGALSTVDEATDRGIGVVAVPGSTLSPASAGTNALLIDGASPVRNAADVLDALGLDQPAPFDLMSGGTPTQLAMPLDPGVDPDRLLLDELAAGPVHLDRLIERLGVAPPIAAARIEGLAAKGKVVMSGHVVSLASSAQRVR